MIEQSKYTILDSAIKCAESGLPVFPAAGKRPIFKNWQSRASVDEHEIRKMFSGNEYNIAVAVPWDVAVLDFDKKHGGLETLVQIERDVCVFPATLRQQTGGGGQQIFFKIPVGLNVKNFVGLAQGLDIRAHGGLVIVPPSLHPDTKLQYRWFTGQGPGEVEIAECPGPLAAWLRERVAAGPTNEKRMPVNGISLVGEGGRNDFLVREAGALRRRGFSEEVMVAALSTINSEMCNPALNDDEVAQIARSVAAKAPDSMEIAIAEARNFAANLTDFSADNIFASKNLEHFARLRRYEPAIFGKIRAKLKTHKTNMRDFVAAINAVQLNATPEDDLDVEEPLTLPLELVIPHGWRLTRRGIEYIDGKMRTVVSRTPVIVTQKRICSDTTAQKLVLSWLTGDEVWREVVVPRSVALDGRKLVSLADVGFPCSSETSRGLVKWLDALDCVNNWPTVRTVSQLGWSSAGFAPVDDVTVDGGEGSESYLAAYSQKGSFETWKQHAQKIRKQYPLARAALSAAFGAPLLHLTGSRTFLLHLWGASRGGKTAAAKFAASVWGCPDELLTTFNATRVGLERLAAFYRDLPLIIDERQLLGDRQRYVEGLAYLLGAQKGKLRGSKQGLQQTKIWRTIALMTGEQPLAGDSTTAGVKTRTLELSGLPVEDEAVARDIHEWTAEHHGWAGAEFIRFIKNVEDIPEFFKSFRTRITDAYPTAATSHVEALTVLAVADLISSFSVFGEDPQAAEKSTDQWVMGIATFFESAEEMSDATRAAGFLRNWLAKHNRRFQTSCEEPWGVVLNNNTTAVLTDVFDKALAEGGFVPSKLRKELRPAVPTR